MSTITIESKAFKIIMDKLELLECTIKALTANNGFSKWMPEAEVMMMTGLSARRLRDLRKEGKFNYSTASGRKIKYLRKEVEAYLNNHSTVIPLKKAS